MNQKGGVGKTSLTLGLAVALAEAGRRPLVVDLDPQANATAALADGAAAWTSNDLLRPDPDSGDVVAGSLAEAIAAATPAWPGVSLVAAEMALASREQDQTVGREFRLRAVGQGVNTHDLALIDCPPSLGQLALNALVAADAVLLVTEPAAASLSGLAAVGETIEQTRRYYNPSLRLAGVVVNKHQTTRVEARTRVDELSDAFGEQLWQPFIADREVVNRAYGAGQPVQSFGAAGRSVAADYAALADLLTAAAHKER
jgi:chromosome partitioning protein